MSNKSILFVDDEEIVVKSYRKNLIDLDYVVDTAFSGEEAIEKITNSHFNMVITDMVMPGIDGFGVLKAAKNHHSETGVIILTGYGDLDSSINALRLGADDYLQKPCDTEELTIRIERYFASLQLTAQVEIEKLRVQKLELSQTLASGIAHDYNNLLAAIMGGLDLAILEIPPSNLGHAVLETVLQSCMKATDLTHNFLMLSNTTITPDKTAISLSDLIHKTNNSIINNEGINSKLVFPDNLWKADIDPEKVGQAIRNIFNNAHESMPEGGTLQVTAKNIDKIGKEPNTAPHLPAGQYIKLAIKDNGRGISVENVPKIFDPYFSTKQKCSQKGMGLGLPLAQVFIEKSGGHIQVESEISSGTKVICYLPAVG